jgi:hypothetical protein
MYGPIELVQLCCKEISGFLEDNGFRRCGADICVMLKITDDGEQIVILIYVDNMLVLAEKEEHRMWVKKLL